MAVSTAYTTNKGRINRIKGEMLAHAVHAEVLAMGCRMKRMPTREGDTIIYRRYLPKGAASTDHNTINRPAVTVSDHVLQEGVTPSADSLTPQDVSITMQQYGVLYTYSDKAAELYEDDIPEAERIHCGERMGLVREMIRYGAMKAATNVIYSGGSSRTQVDESISLRSIRRMTRTLKRNHAKMIKTMLAASPNYATFPVEPAYCVFAHTDCEADLRDLPNFKTVTEYGSRQQISKHEIGSCESFRFILSPELAPYPNGGGDSAGTGLESTGGSKVDVYPYLVCAQDSVWDVALRGMSSFDIKHIPHTRVDKSDPLGQRGYIGGDFWSAVRIVNNGWYGVVEAGVADLD